MFCIQICVCLEMKATFVYFVKLTSNVAWAMHSLFVFLYIFVCDSCCSFIIVNSYITVSVSLFAGVVNGIIIILIKLLFLRVNEVIGSWLAIHVSCCCINLISHIWFLLLLFKWYPEFWTQQQQKIWWCWLTTARDSYI